MKYVFFIVILRVKVIIFEEKINMVLQILKDYGELISITLIPFIIWGLGSYFQNRKSKKDTKLNLFLTLMANRKSSPISKDWVDALNQIDVVFQDDKKVRLAWRQFYDALHPKSPHFDTQNSFHLDLLSEMANSLGYKDLKQTEIDRFYLPKGLSTERQELLYSETLRVLQSSKSYSEPFSEDELDKHLEDLSNKYNL